MKLASFRLKNLQHSDKTIKYFLHRKKQTQMHKNSNAFFVVENLHISILLLMEKSVPFGAGLDVKG